MPTLEASLVGDRPTDAELLREELRRKGISSDAITAEHAQDLYARMQASRDPPDLETGRAILERVDVPQVTYDKPVGLIVETRCHRHLEFVVRQAHDMIGLRVQLFHGPANAAFIRTRLGDLIRSGKLVLSELASDRMNGRTYNGMFLTEAFWHRVIGRGKVLVFQTDAVFCSRSDYTLEDFLDYDGIGSAWHPSRPVGLEIGGGNGGLSLRDWPLTLSCLRRFPAEAWCGGEDGYFMFHMELIGGRVGKGDASARFGSQVAFLRRSFGAHQPSAMGFRDQARFLAYCPQAWRILEPQPRRLFRRVRHRMWRLLR